MLPLLTKDWIDDWPRTPNAHKLSTDLFVGRDAVMQCDDKPLDVSLTRISPNLYQPACRMSSPPPESGHLEPILGVCIGFCSFAVFCIHEPCRAIFLIQKILS